MELNDPKFQQLVKLMEDYKDLIWSNQEISDKLMYYLGRAISKGIDINDQELKDFEILLKDKINQFVKEKAN